MNKRDEIKELLLKYHTCDGYNLENADKLIRAQHRYIHSLPSPNHYQFFRWSFVVCAPMALCFILTFLIV